MLLLRRVLVHLRGSLFLFNDLLIELKLLILLIGSFVTDVDAVTDNRVGEPVMRFSVRKIISHFKGRVRRQLLLALRSVRWNHVKARSRQRGFESMRSLAWSFGASGEKPTDPNNHRGQATHGSFIQAPPFRSQRLGKCAGAPMLLWAYMVAARQRYGASGRRVGLIFTVLIATLSAADCILAQNYQGDAADSQSLTTYLRQHRLPLVGAQVLKGSDGSRRIVLYGFVATEFGRNDAVRKAMAYFAGQRTLGGTAAPSIENHIEIRPEIARMKSRAQGNAEPDTPKESLDEVLGDIDRYGVKMVPAPTNPK